MMPDEEKPAKDSDQGEPVEGVEEFSVILLLPGFPL